MTAVAQHEERRAPSPAPAPQDAGLPSFEDGALPPAEPRGRTLWIRAVSISALAVSAIYLVWRAVFTVDMAVWFVALPMLALEVHHAFGLGIYTFSLWDVVAPPPPPPVIGTDLRVAVLIPTYDESVEVLLPVISAAITIAPAHETWVLDDGHRLDIRRLAEDLGARYLTRPDNSHAKAGNLNHALEHIDADIVAVVDADHVVMPGFLTNTLGYFRDSDVAVVQTPQAFYNMDSFEHQDRGEERGIYNEQSVFYRVILPAKNRWNAVFWCGTGALVRVAALREVGGVATESITEDILTSIRMHKAGWRIVGHNEVLARGLAAADAQQYMLQRHRWARGAMQVMKSERLVSTPKLEPTQRLAYLATLWGWFDALRSLLFVLLPITVLATGAIPIRASIVVFGPMFLGTFLVQFAALRMLARGHHPPILSLTFEMLRMPAVVPALGELFSRGGSHRFLVTPKGRVGDERHRSKAPLLLVALVALSSAAAVWAALTFAGLTPVTYDQPGAIHGTMAFLGLNVVLILIALRRIRDARFAGERRASVRFDVDLPASWDGEDAVIRDLSLTGARVVLPRRRLDDRTPPLALLDIPIGEVSVRAMVVQVGPDDSNGVDMGLQFLPGQWEAIRRLTFLLFHGVCPTRVVMAKEPEAMRIAS